MNFWRRVAVLAPAVLLLNVAYSPIASADPLIKICVRQAQQNPSNAAFHVPDNVKQLVLDIASSVGLSTEGLTIIRCDLLTNAAAMLVFADEKNVPKGEYIAYNSTWLRGVAGQDKTQAYALFGHELGHLVARHTIKVDLPSHTKELEADTFAGCAVARMGGKWESLASLLQRIRPDDAGEYPSAAESVAAAKESFERCGQKSVKNALTFVSVTLDRSRSSFRMTKNDLSIHAEREPETRLGIEFDRDMMAVTASASCRGVRGEEPIEEALSVWRNLIARRGESHLLAKITDYSGYRKVVLDENMFAKMRPTLSELKGLRRNNQDDFSIVMKWLADCIGLADPVLTWTLRNESDEVLTLTSIQYDVLDIGQVKGGGPETLEPIDVEPHELDWSKGVQVRDLNPQIVVPPKTSVAVRVMYKFDRSNFGLTWLVKPKFVAAEGATVDGPVIKMFAAKGKHRP